MKKQYILLALTISLTMQQSKPAIVFAWPAALSVKALAAKWAAYKTIVIVGSVTVEKAAAGAALAGLAIGTHIIVSRLWNASRETLDPSARAQIDALNLEHKQFNDTEMQKDALYAETMQKLQDEFKQSETTVLNTISSVQMQFARYCNTHNIASTTTNMPPEGVKMRNQIDLLYYCLGTINL